MIGARRDASGDFGNVLATHGDALGHILGAEYGDTRVFAVDGEGNADEREIAVAARELEEGEAPGARPGGKADRDQDLVGLERGGEEALEKIGRRHGALAAAARDGEAGIA